MPRIFFKMPSVFFQVFKSAATFFALYLTWAEKWTCADVMTFLSAHDFGPEKWRSAYVMTFFALHLILGRKRT